MALPDGYLRAVYAAVRATGGLAIADEVQVGYGRTGRWFWSFQQQGVVPDMKAAIGQVNAILADTRESLKKMDAVLVEAKAVGANARVATEDLGTLRAEVESNLRKVEGLINEINRKWPFKRDTEIKLP